MARCSTSVGIGTVKSRKNSSGMRLRPPAPYIDALKLNHPAYDSFWAAAAALGCAIGVHPSPHGDMPNSCRLLGLADGVTNPMEGLALRQGLGLDVRPYLSAGDGSAGGDVTGGLDVFQNLTPSLNAATPIVVSTITSVTHKRASLTSGSRRSDLQASTIDST